MLNKKNNPWRPSPTVSGPYPVRKPTSDFVLTYQTYPVLAAFALFAGIVLVCIFISLALSSCAGGSRGSHVEWAQGNCATTNGTVDVASDDCDFIKEVKFGPMREVDGGQ